MCKILVVLVVLFFSWMQFLSAGEKSIVVNPKEIKFSQNVNKSKHTGYAKMEIDKDFVSFFGGMNCYAWWSGPLPQVIDSSEYDYIAIKYKYTGVDIGNFIVFISDGEKGYDYPLLRSDLIADGQWHWGIFKIEKKFKIKNFQVTLVSRTESNISVGKIIFSTGYPTLSVSDYIDVKYVETLNRSFNSIPFEHVKDANFTQFTRVQDWFKTQFVECNNIPFSLPATASLLPIEGQGGHIHLPLDKNTKEIFLLLAVDLPEKIAVPNRGFRSDMKIDEVERFIVEIKYSDGSSDMLFPFTIPGRVNAISEGLGVYALNVLESKVPKELILYNKMSTGKIGIVAATSASEIKFKDPEITYRLPNEDKKNTFQETGKPEINITGNVLSISNGLISGQFDLSNCFSPKSLTVAGAAPEKFAISSGAIFKCMIEEIVIESKDWKFKDAVKDGEASARVKYIWEKDGNSLEGCLYIEIKTDGQLLLNFEIQNTGNTVCSPKIYFPCLKEMSIGKSKDTWHFITSDTVFIGKEPFAFFERALPFHSLQIDGIFNPNAGWGVSFSTHDTEGAYRWYGMKHDNNGFDYELSYVGWTLQPNEKRKYPEFSLRPVNGGWREQFDIYKKWVRINLKPIVETPEKFRRSFGMQLESTRQEWYDNKKLLWPRIIESFHNRFYGIYPDIFHIYKWHEYGLKPEGNSFQWGLYDSSDFSLLKKTAQQMRDKGVMVSLYMDIYLASIDYKDNEINKKFEKWAIRDKNNKFDGWTGSKSAYQCYFTPWTDYIVKEYMKVVRESSPDIVYYDEAGTGHEFRFCYSQEHGHPVPMPVLYGELMALKKMREELPDNISGYMEFEGLDVHSKYVQGALQRTYSKHMGEEFIVPHYLDLLRFAIPAMKRFHWTTSPGQFRWKDGNWGGFNKIWFFNADGFMQGAHIYADEDSRRFVSKGLGILQKYSDVFASDDVEPLIPSAVPGIFINQFKNDKGTTIWTVYNSNYRTIRGQIFKVKHVPESIYTDVWNWKDVSIEIKDGIAGLNFEIGPRETGCIVRKIQD